ncbi:MAG: hypothetical protein WA977_06600 [Halobacteriota archaeon]
MANRCILKFLDEILESLRDLQWHSLDEIRTQVSLSLPLSAEEKLNKILPLLEIQEFISIDVERGRAKIKPMGLKFLGLPSEN